MKKQCHDGSKSWNLRWLVIADNTYYNNLEVEKQPTCCQLCSKPMIRIARVCWPVVLSGGDSDPAAAAAFYLKASYGAVGLRLRPLCCSCWQCLHSCQEVQFRKLHC